MTNEIVNLVAWIVTTLVTNTTEHVESSSWGYVLPTNPPQYREADKTKTATTRVERITVLRFPPEANVPDIERKRETVSITEVHFREVVTKTWEPVSTNELAIWPMNGMTTNIIVPGPGIMVMTNQGIVTIYCATNNPNGSNYWK